MEYLDIKDGLLTKSPFDRNGFNEPHGTLSKKTITKSQKRLTLWNFTNIIDYIIKLEIF